MPSTVIAKYDYNPATETLRVVYTTGKVYDYQHVPEKVYDDMKASFAKGIFLNRNIKGKYPFVEVNAAPNLFSGK
jgi:hypothetical protein